MIMALIIRSGGTVGESEPAPPGEFDSPVSGDIDFADSDFQFSRVAYGGTGYWARSPYGFVEFRTSETALDIKVGGNRSGFGVQSQIEVFVDGVYNQSVELTADNTTQEKPITLPGGSKIVRLVNGYTADDGANINTPAYGVFVQGVVTTGNIEIKNPVTPEDLWYFIGDSITTGASATHPVATSFAAQFREDGREVQVDAWGARLMNTTDTTQAGLMADFISSQLVGSVSNTVFVLLGTNNFGLSNQSKATYKANYERFLDALHAERSDIRIICVSPIERGNYDTPNAGGATLEDYADAIQEALSTRAWAEFIYGRDLVSLANLPDGVHPNQTGHDEMHDNLLTEYNAL